MHNEVAEFENDESLYTDETETLDGNQDKNNNEDYKKVSIIKNGFISIVYQILAIITPLITAPYVSRVLNPSGIGVYSYTHSLVTYFVLFAGLGTLGYGTREISRRRLDKKECFKAFFEIELLTIITSIISLGIWIIVALVYKEYKIYLLICSFYIIATMLDISWFYVGLEKVKYTVSINAIFKILGVVSVFLFVKNEEDVFNYIMINALSLALGNLSMWIFLPKNICKASISIKSFGNHLKETLVYFIPTIATSIYTVLDKTLLGIICDDDALNGYYEQGTKIVNMAKAVSFYSIVNVVSPRMSFFHKIEKKEEAKELAKNTLNVIMFLTIATTLGVIAIADIFVPMFYGSGYNKVIYVLYMMMPLCIIVSISNFIGGLYYTPVGKRKQSSIYLIIGSVINLILNCILIPFIDIYGAIIATLIAEIIISLLYFANCNGFIGLVDLVKAMWKKIISGLCMIIVIVLLKKINFNVFNRTIYDLLFENIVLILAGGATYLMLNILLRDKIFGLLIKKK